MSENFTRAGFDRMSELLVDHGPVSVAVGSGSKGLSDSDTGLDQEIYRTSINNSNASLNTTSKVGEVEASISVAGGTEVDPGDSITELGLFLDNGSMMYRTVRESVEISEGERLTFTFRFSLVNVE